MIRFAFCLALPLTANTLRMRLRNASIKTNPIPRSVQHCSVVFDVKTIPISQFLHSISAIVLVRSGGGLVVGAPSGVWGGTPAWDWGGTPSYILAANSPWVC